MTPIKIEALKGMDSSVVQGLSDSPVLLRNVLHTRDGGYKPRPGKTLLLSGLLAFRQFAATRYAYYRTGAGSFLIDLKEEDIFSYPGSLPTRDIMVYGDKVVASGSVGTSSLPRFGALGLDSFVDETESTPTSSEIIPGPDDGIYSHVVTQAATVTMAVHDIIANIIVDVECVAHPGGFVRAPTGFSGPWIHNTDELTFQSGGIQMVLVCFRKKPGSSGTVLNPGEAKPNWLQNQFLISIPDQPHDASNTPINGPYKLKFNFTGIPFDYEPIFFTSTSMVRNGGYGVRDIPYYEIGATKAVNDAVLVNTASGYKSVWYVVAGTGPLPDVIPEAMKADAPPLNSSAKAGAMTLVFVGYAMTSHIYSPVGAPLDDGRMYSFLTGETEMGAPLYLMADYINSAIPGGNQPAYNPYYRWLRVMATSPVADEYLVTNEPSPGAEEAPIFAPFFPVGSRAAQSSARVWVAPDYIIKGLHSGATVIGLHSPSIITRVTREYAASGIRTLFYSEPNSLEFNEQFIIPPFKKSRSISAVSATSAGVVVLGDSDAVLISGDSLASFRATAIDIPGTISQATVTQWRGAMFYANAAGMFVLADGSGAKQISNPVSREWGTPISLCLNERDGTILVSFAERDMLHYDIQRDAWSIWTESSHASAPTAYDYHMVISTTMPALLSKLTGTASTASVEYVVDAGATDIRKQWDRISYRRESFVNETILQVKASNKTDWTTCSVVSNPENNVMLHRINEHSTSLRFRITFSGDTVIGGPLTVNVKQGEDTSRMKTNGS